VATLSDRAGILIIANIVKFAIGVVLPMSLVRLLTPDEYGTYQQLNLIGTVAASLMLFGLPTSVYYFFGSQMEKRSGALVSQTTWMLVGSGILTALFLAIAADYLGARVNNPAIAELLPAFAVAVGLTIAVEHSYAVMVSRDRYLQALGFEAGEALLRMGLMLAPIALGFGMHGLMVGLVLFAGGRLLIRGTLLFRGSEGSRMFAWDGPFIAQQLKYAIPMALLALISLVGSTVNRGVIAAEFSASDYAIYSVGCMAFPFATVFQSSVANVLRAKFPALVADGNYAEIARIIRESVRKLSLLALPIFVFLFVNADLFITTLFTEEYRESVKVFRVTVCELPLEMFILSSVPQVFGKTKLNLYVNIARNLYMGLATWVLVRAMGMVGAALAAVSAEYVTVLLFFLTATSLTRSSFLRITPLAAIIKVLAAAMPGALVSHYFGDFSTVPIFNLAIAGILYGLCYLPCALALGVFTRADRELALRWIGRVLPAASSR